MSKEKLVERVVYNTATKAKEDRLKQAVKSSKTANIKSVEDESGNVLITANPDVKTPTKAVAPKSVKPKAVAKSVNIKKK